MYNKLCRIHGKLDLMNIHESDEASGSSSVPAEALMSVTIGGQWREPCPLYHVYWSLFLTR